MQHIWEFLVKAKATEENTDPEFINRMFVTESSRKKKVSEQILKKIEKDFNLKQEDMKDFYVRQLR